MSRKAAEVIKCPLCGNKDVTEPRGDERYCRDCWDRKIAVEDVVAREFTLKRYIRATSGEKYLVFHSTQKRPIGHLLVIDDGKASDVCLPHGPLRCFYRVTWRTCEQVFGHRVGD